MTVQRVCIFCGSTPLTKEHVYRDSLRDLFPEMTDRKYAWTNTTSGTLRPIHGPLFDTVVKRVCASCNNGWMNDIDITVEPYLRHLVGGGPCTIDDAGSRAIADWAARLTMVRGFYGKRAPAIDPADLAFMYRRHTVPDAWYVYLAARENPWVHDTWIGDSGSSGFSPDPAKHHQHFAMIYVLGLGPVVVFVTGAGGWPHGAIQIRNAATHVLDTMRPNTVQLAPVARGFSWPPARPLRDEEVSSVHEAFVAEAGTPQRPL